MEPDQFMIPDLDEDGYLPPGIHEATFEELVERFGNSIQTRVLRTWALNELFNLVEEYAIGMYIDGSYVTNKIAPGDIDILLIVPEDFDYQTSEGQKLATFLRIAKTKYRLDLYIKRNRKSNANNKFDITKCIFD